MKDMYDVINAINAKRSVFYIEFIEKKRYITLFYVYTLKSMPHGEIRSSRSEYQPYYEHNICSFST